MSIPAMNMAWRMALPPTSKLILLALADNANDQGECWPSLRNIATRCQVSPRTVQRLLKSFEREGLIRVLPRFGSDGRQTSNRYLLTFTESQGEGDKLSPPVVKQCVEGGMSVTLPATEPCHGGDATALSPRESSQESFIESSTNEHPRMPESLSAFERLQVSEMLKGLDSSAVGEVLRELNFAIRARQIRTTPVRWLAGLLRRRAQGVHEHRIWVAQRPVQTEGLSVPMPTAVQESLRQVVAGLRAKSQA